MQCWQGKHRTTGHCSHSPAVLSPTSNSDLVERVLILPMIKDGLARILIPKLNLPAEPLAGLNYTLKVVCGLVSTDPSVNREWFLHGAHATLDEKYCFAFLSFTRMPLHEVPLRAGTTTPTMNHRRFIPAIMWFTLEENGQATSVHQSLTDLSFNIQWDISRECLAGIF
ncbi:hypothetical protein OF83DRAFT_1088545 [Amylostereum chailletii]|nr:hypothetical protein OF83DRAFT_1088545 [Amylostereum chailletii]